MTGPDGIGYTRGEPAAQGRDLSIDLNPLGPAGTYTVAFRVVSADGHPISGQYTFELTRPVTNTTDPPTNITPPAAATQNSQPGNQFPAWIIAAAAIALLAITITAVLRRPPRRQ